MKLFKRLVAMMVMAFFLLTGSAFLQNQALAGGKEPKQVEIFGTIQNSPNGLIIMSEGKQYRLEGQDLSAMKGKMVTLKGTVTEDGGKRVLNVTSIAGK